VHLLDWLLTLRRSENDSSTFSLQMYDKGLYGLKDGSESGAKTVTGMVLSVEDPTGVCAAHTSKQLKSRAAALSVHAYMLAHGLTADSHPFPADPTAERKRKLLQLRAKYLDLGFALRHQDLFECKISYCGIYQIGWRFTPIAAAESSGAFKESHAHNQVNSSQYINFGTNCSQDLTLNSFNSGWQPEQTWKPCVAPSEEQLEVALYLREYFLTLQDTYVQNTTIQLFYSVCALNGKAWMQRVIRESRGAKRFCFMFPDFFLIHKGSQLRIMAIDPRIFCVGYLGTPDYILRGLSLHTVLSSAVAAQERAAAISGSMTAGSISSSSSSSGARSRQDVRRERVRNRAPKVSVESLRSAAAELGVRNSNNTDVEKFDQSVFTCLPGFLYLYRADQAKGAYITADSHDCSATLQRMLGETLYLGTDQEDSTSNSSSGPKGQSLAGREPIFEGEDIDGELKVCGDGVNGRLCSSGSSPPAKLRHKEQELDDEQDEDEDEDEDEGQEMSLVINQQRVSNTLDGDSSEDGRRVKGIGDGNEQQEEKGEQRREGNGEEEGERVARLVVTQSIDSVSAVYLNDGIEGESKIIPLEKAAAGDPGVSKGGGGEGYTSGTVGGGVAVNVAGAQEGAEMEIEMEENEMGKMRCTAGEVHDACDGTEDGDMAKLEYGEDEGAGRQEEVGAEDNMSLLPYTADSGAADFEPAVPAPALETQTMDMDAQEDMRSAMLSSFPQSLLDDLIESMCDSLMAYDNIDIRSVAKSYVSDRDVQERFGAVLRLFPFLDVVKAFPSTFYFLSSKNIDSLWRGEGQEEEEVEEEKEVESAYDRLLRKYEAEKILQEDREKLDRQTALDFNIFMRMHQATHSFEYLADWYTLNLPEGDASKVIQDTSLRCLCSRYPKMFRVQGGDGATVLALDVQAEENRVKSKCRKERNKKNRKKAAAEETCEVSEERRVALQMRKERVQQRNEARKRNREETRLRKVEEARAAADNSLRAEQSKQENRDDIRKMQIKEDRRKGKRESARQETDGGPSDTSFDKNVLRQIAYSFRDYLLRYPSKPQPQAIRSFVKTYGAGSTEAAAIQHFTLHKICSRFNHVFRVRKGEDGTSVLFLLDSPNTSELMSENMRMKQDNAIRKVQQAEEERIRREITEQNDRDGVSVSATASVPANPHKENETETETEVRHESKAKRGKIRENDKERDRQEKRDKEMRKERELAVKSCPRYPLEILIAAAAEFHQYLLLPQFHGAKIPYPKQVEGFCESGRSQGRNVLKAMGVKLFCAAVPAVLMIARDNDIYTVVPTQQVSGDGVRTVSSRQHPVRDIEAAAHTFRSYLHSHSSNSEESSSPSKTSKSRRLSGKT
jgi:hypothetical protein